MRLSLNATRRWRACCPDVDMETELASAKGASKRVLRLLADPNYDGTGRRAPQENRYMVTDSGIVLVVAPDETVITVFLLDEAKARVQEKRRFVRRAATKIKLD